MTVNLNAAMDEDILSIPGAGLRMVREFKEYRPWKTKGQFEKQIGKYVGPKRWRGCGGMWCSSSPPQVRSRWRWRAPANRSLSQDARGLSSSRSRTRRTCARAR
jgi:hypothetical protein